MSYTVFLGNLPVWVTKDDIKSWLNSENLVYDDVKVIRNPETQESKGFAFIDTPNSEEMQSIIRRFDRAPLEDRLLRANQAQPPKAKGGPAPVHAPMASRPPAAATPVASTATGAVAQPAGLDRGPRRERGGKKHKRTGVTRPPERLRRRTSKSSVSDVELYSVSLRARQIRSFPYPNSWVVPSFFLHLPPSSRTSVAFSVVYSMALYVSCSIVATR